MRRIYLIAILFLYLGVSNAVAQVHINFHLDNTDVETRIKLSTLTRTVSARNAELARTNRQLTKILMHHRAQLADNYQRNRFDKGDGFFLNASGSLATGVATLFLDRFPSLPYMSSTRREYLKSMAMGKSVLIALNRIDASKVKSGKRQEIYQLRSELIREFSKHDREARKMLAFSVAGLALADYVLFTELMQQLNAIEIAL